MKKTLLVTIDFWPQVGGVANYYGNLCSQLGDQVVVLTNKTSKHLNIETSNQEFKFKIIRRNLLINWLWPEWLIMFWYIWRVAKQEQIEMLWVGEVLPTGIVVYFLSKILKLPYMVSCHGMDILQAQRVDHKRKMAQKVLQAAKYVTVNSQYTGVLVSEMGVSDDNLKVVYPGVEHKNIKTLKHESIKNGERFIKKYNLEGKKIILSVGRMVARKGFDKVIETMSSVLKEVPEAVYVIGGDGSDRERLEHLSTESALAVSCVRGQAKAQKHIIFLGEVSNEEKWMLMELCDVFVMPARQVSGDVEGFGIVYLEANSCGKPVIAGDVGGAREAVIDNETGLLVNPESIKEISQVLIKLLSNKELMVRLGRQGQARVAKEFLWEQRANEIRKFLD